MDVIIIGGGVIGMLTARELHAAGARVSILERQAPGKESSWAGGGILSPLNPWQVPEAIARLCRWSQAAYPTLADDLLASTGIDPEWQQSGLMFKLGGEQQTVVAWAEREQLRFEILDDTGIGLEEPGVHVDPGDSAILFPDLAHIRNPRLLAALIRDLELRGVQILNDAPVSELDFHEGQVRAVVTPQGKHLAERFVIAAGAWSGRFGESTSAAVDVQPVRGQMLVFRSEPGVLRHIVLEDGCYLIPRRDGRILAGSTLEYAGFDKTTTEEAGKALADFAHRLLPALKNYPLEKHWAGLRPGTPDGIPFIGQHPSIANLYFNCGHFRNGLVMGPASARLMADLLVGRPAILDSAPYAIPA